ncbi:uncharacterized protein [Magallana gigas]|uniref:uncharacterized protein n=1 Tax=Magallana gigas TaxID=29159 RepID=UPI003341F404
MLSKRRAIALDKSSVKKKLSLPCSCAKNCQKQFSVQEILYWRQRIHCIPAGEERIKKLAEMIQLCAITIRKYERDSLYRINQKLCCRHFFTETVLGISIPTLTRAKRAIQENRHDLNVRTPRVGTNGVRGRVCEGFIAAYMNAACDRDPTGNIFRMPAGLTKLDLHSLYQTIHKDGIGKSKFYNILDSKYRNLVFCKNQRFTKCTDCHNFRCLIEKEQDTQIKSDYIAMRNLHLKEQQMEREAYYVRRGQAEMRPKEILSLIIDGMDQNKTDLPHYCKWSNPSGAGQQKLRTHITGSIVHGRGKYFFIDHGQIPHDTNLSLSCLMKILSNESHNGILPPTLYVQLDNTARENKNKYFLGMMAYLVKHDFVKEVYMSFLLVGHTHEDVDQCFSKISQKLKEKDALTMPNLEALIFNSQTPQPHVSKVNTVWNISGWLEPFINQVHNITFPKMYRVQKDGTGHVYVQYKKLSTEEQWHPTSDERQLEIFKLDDVGCQMTPPGIPNQVHPYMAEEDIQTLMRSLDKDFKLAQFTDECTNWWKEFLASEILGSNEETWPTLNRTTEVDPMSTLSEKELDLIEKYKEKRSQFKEVFTKQGTDRRKYKKNDMVVVKISKTEVNIGEVRSVNGEDLELNIFKRNKGCFTSTDHIVSVRLSSCFATGFQLTNSKNIPSKIKERIAQENLKLV